MAHLFVEMYVDNIIMPDRVINLVFMQLVHQQIQL